MISRIKGTQDFLDMSLYNFITHQAADHFTTYHFAEIATPIIEPCELFQRSLGEHTDVVNKEMFVIEKGEHSELICLRPEATASTVRAFVQNNVPTTPWKVFSYGPMFRYERPQKGRYRQFHQINVEIIGSSAISQDVHLIKMLDRFFAQKLKLENFALALNYLGCPQDRNDYKKQLHDYLSGDHAKNICKTCIVRKEKNIMRVFDCKNQQCQSIYKDAPKLTDHLCSQCAGEWQSLQDQLQMLSVSFVIRPTLVRGLDYYNKTVFEFVSDDLGAQNAFCGGGRYDSLVKEIGAKNDCPSIGAAMGVERIMLLLENKKDQLPLKHDPMLYCVIPFAKEQHTLALFIADTLQANGLCADILLEDNSPKSKMRQANKAGASYALLVGDQELQDKTVTVKNMMNGTQETIKQVDLIAYLSHF